MARFSQGKLSLKADGRLKLKVAQASIREALNILIAEGFVQKEPGRSATVTTLNDRDLYNIYEVRASLESLAGRLVAERRPDLSDLDQVIADMRAAADCNNAEAFYRRDLSFHLLVCQKSGNPVLEQSIRRIVGPLFAFVVMRIHAKRRDLEELRESVEHHRQMLEVLRSGDPETAERHFSASIRRFLIDTQGMVNGDKRTAPARE